MYTLSLLEGFIKDLLVMIDYIQSSIFKRSPGPIHARTRKIRNAVVVRSMIGTSMRERFTKSEGR